MENDGDLQKEYRISAIIAGSMGAALLVYTAIVEFFKLQYNPFAGFSPQTALQVKEYFLFGVLLVLVGIRRARKSILKKEKTDNKESLMNKLRIATIATFALGEVPALMGLIMFFMGGVTKEYYILLTCSIITMFIYFPRYRHWQAFVGRTSSFF